MTTFNVNYSLIYSSIYSFNLIRVI